jgi:hypothetical protein
MSSNLSPVDVSFRLFGGYKGVAGVLGMSEKSPLAWKRPSKYREAGDFPNTSILRTLLAAARQRRIPLTADHLIYGASEAEIAALLTVPVAACAL